MSFNPDERPRIIGDLNIYYGASVSSYATDQPVTWSTLDTSFSNTFSLTKNATNIYYSHVFQLAGLPDASSWANIKIVTGSSSANNSTIGDFSDIQINNKEYGFTQGGNTSYRSGLVKSEFVIDTWSGDKKIGLAIALWNNNNEMGLNGLDFFDNTRYYLSNTLLAGISNTMIYSIM